MPLRSTVAVAALAGTLAAATALAQTVGDTATPAQTVGDSATAGQVARPATATSGARVYREICQACHMADGRGGSGAATFPALARNPKLQVSGYPITMVVQGKGGMPAFADLLTPEQIAGVVGYVRTNFGNRYREPVTVEEVRQIYPQGTSDH